MTIDSEKSNFDTPIWRSFIIFNRFNWKKQRPERVRQLLFRLLPLIMILVLSTSLVLIFRSADLRNRLDESVFNGVSTRTFQGVHNYFNPILDMVSSSLLWTSVGQIDSIGEPESYIELLEEKLKAIGTVSSFSLTDSAGRELVLQMPEGQESSWYITAPENERSLSAMRELSNIQYMTLEKENKEEIPEGQSGTYFRISTPYQLPLQETPGITLRLDASSGPENTGLTICLDLPLKQMAKRLQDEGAVREAVIFLLMPSKEDYIFLPVDELLKINENSLNATSEIMTPLENEVSRLVELFSSSEKKSGPDDIRFRFNYNEKIWLTDFLNIRLGDEILSIGTLVPEEALWTTQAAGPIQILLLGLLVSTGFLLFRLIQDYTKVTQSPARIEELLRDEIAGGESSHLEFKSSLRWDYRDAVKNKALEDIIVKSVAAFNNAEGGTLIIGVADDGEILGIEKDYEVLRQAGKDYYEIHLRNLLSSKYGVGYTSKNITIDFPWLSGHEICRIRIRRGREPLYTGVKSKSGAQVEKFFIRSGNTSQVLDNISEVTDYILSRFSRWTFGKSLSKPK